MEDITCPKCGCACSRPQTPKGCPCGDEGILADTEDCKVPLCPSCYEEICALERPQTPQEFEMPSESEIIDVCVMQGIVNGWGPEFRTELAEKMTSLFRSRIKEKGRV